MPNIKLNVGGNNQGSNSNNRRSQPNRNNGGTDQPRHQRQNTASTQRNSNRNQNIRQSNQNIRSVAPAPRQQPQQEEVIDDFLNHEEPVAEEDIYSGNKAPIPGSPSFIEPPKVEQELSQSFIPQEEDEDDEEITGRKSKRRKDKKANKRNGSNSSKRKNNKAPKNTKKDGTSLTQEEAYAKYRTRKTIVLVCLILAAVGLLVFGTYNTFFKKEMTPQEAAAYTNRVNGQAVNQKWDSGIQSYLQANLKNMMKPYVSTINNGTGDNDYQVSNISIERNVPCGDDMFMTFFSADLTFGNATERVFCNVFISTADDKMDAASKVNITAREPYSNPSDKLKDNPYLKFDDEALNSNDSKEFQNVLENFLTLAYNSKQDVSNIYKGQGKLQFDGTFKSLDKCQVYDEPNQLGFNAFAQYTVELPNGVQYQTDAYYRIEKNSSGSYVINSVL